MWPMGLLLVFYDVAIYVWKNKNLAYSSLYVWVNFVISDFDKNLLAYINFVFIETGLFCFNGSQQKRSIYMQGLYI